MSHTHKDTCSEGMPFIGYLIDLRLPARGRMSSRGKEVTAVSSTRYTASRLPSGEGYHPALIPNSLRDGTLPYVTSGLDDLGSTGGRYGRRTGLSVRVEPSVHPKYFCDGVVTLRVISFQFNILPVSEPTTVLLITVRCEASCP